MAYQLVARGSGSPALLFSFVLVELLILNVSVKIIHKPGNGRRFFGSGFPGLWKANCTL